MNGCQCLRDGQFNVRCDLNFWTSSETSSLTRQGHFIVDAKKLLAQVAVSNCCNLWPFLLMPKVIESETRKIVTVYLQPFGSTDGEEFACTSIEALRLDSKARVSHVSVDLLESRHSLIKLTKLNRASDTAPCMHGKRKLKCRQNSGF